LEGTCGAFGSLSRTGEVDDRVGEEEKRNSLKSYRESLFISRAELARKTGLSVGTIARVEKGEHCRLETRKKIIQALGLEASEINKIFGNDA